MSSEIYNNTIDNHFKYPDYTKRLTQLVKEKKNLSLESRELKSQTIISKIWQIDSPKIIINSQDGAFKNQIQDLIKKISLVKPGRKLLKKIINDDLSVIVEPSTQTFFVRNINTLCFNTNETSFYFSLNSTRALYLIQKPLEADLFHELAHKIHPDKNHFVRKRTPSPISNMDDLEEQWAITGINLGDEELYPISENAYLLALNFPCRISHNGVGIPIEATLSPIDQILAFDEVSFEEAQKFIKANQLNLNEKSLCNKSIEIISEYKKVRPFKQAAYHKQLYPLTAACYFGKKTLVDFLIKENPTLQEDDDMGGPLKACFEGYEMELALEVISRFNIPSTDILKALFTWYEHPPLLGDYNVEPLSKILSLLSAQEKCVLFKTLIANHKSLHILKILLEKCQGNERDANGDSLLTLLIKFFRDVKEKPLNHIYALLFNDLINLPQVFLGLDEANKQGETALSLALGCNNPWIVEQIKNIKPNQSKVELQDPENYHGLLSTDYWRLDEILEYGI